jgi:sec-independent protein translocase protein TatA
MPNIGPMEIALVLIVALIILGPKKLPDMGRSVGKGMREFKEAVSGGGKDDDDEKPAITAATAEPSAEQRERTAAAA